MKLESYLRTEISNKLIPLVKKDKCEICESTEKLEVHHVKPFAEILEECLDDLHIERKDTNEYTKKELYMITDYVLGEHFRYKMMTVCHNCHKNVIHKNGTCNIGTGKENWIAKNKIKKECLMNNNQYTLQIYLKKIQNKKLFKDKKKELINKINLRDSRNRQQKSVSLLNKYLKINKLPYVILQKKSNDKRYWIVKNAI